MWKLHAILIPQANDTTNKADTMAQITAVVITRTWQAAQKAGNTYIHRAVCSACGYKGKWTGEAHAAHLASTHRCDR